MEPVGPVSVVGDVEPVGEEAAGAAGGKGSVDPAEGQALLDQIAEIDAIFWETKKA